MQFDTYIIHLKRAQQRRQNVEALSALGKGQTIIVDAVDAHALSDEDKAVVYTPKMLKPRYPFQLTDAEIACFLSHRKAWEMIACGTKDFGLVVEDDVIAITDNARSVVEFAATHCTVADVVRFPKAPRREKGDNVVVDGAMSLMQPDLIGLGMQMQLIGREAAKRLLAMTQHFDRPVDTYAQMQWHHGVRILSARPQIIDEDSQNLGGSTVQRKTKSAGARIKSEIRRPIYRAQLKRTANEWRCCDDQALLDVLIVVEGNRYGLGEDARILKHQLEQLGHRVAIAGHKDRSKTERAKRVKRARRIVHLERVFPRWYSAAAENIIVPNPEWFRRRLIRSMQRCDRVMTKTQNGYDIFSPLGRPTFKLGFTSPDCRDVSVPKKAKGFFHLAGGSFLKGTDELLEVWRRHTEWPDLTILKSANGAPTDLPNNIKLITEHVSVEALRALQNSHGVHLCPSRAEGWGHYIVEAMSTGAVVITTDAPPMNEFIDPQNGFLAKWNQQIPRKLGTVFVVDPDSLEATIEAVLSADEASLHAKGTEARVQFEQIDASFKRQLALLFGDLR